MKKKKLDQVKLWTQITLISSNFISFYPLCINLKLSNFFLDFSKTCWVCFGGEQDDIGAEWIRPCRCRGTTKWVHHKCLMRWVDEKQKGHAYTKVSCPQCNTEYVIIFPPFGKPSNPAFLQI